MCPLLCVIQNKGTPNIFMSQSPELAHVSLCGKKDSAAVIKLRTIKWDDDLGGPDVLAVVLQGVGGGQSVGGPQTKECSKYLRLRKARNLDSPTESFEGISSADTVILGP